MNGIDHYQRRLDASEKLAKEFTNREEIIKHLKTGKDTYVYKFLTPELRNDKEIALASMYLNEYESRRSCGGINVAYMSEELKKDRDIALKAVLVYGQTLEYLKDYQDDWIIVYHAVSKSGSSIRFASERLRDDKSLAVIAVSEERGSIEDISERLKNDVDISYLALKNSYSQVHHIGDEPRKPKYKKLMREAYDMSKYHHVQDEFSNDEYFEFHMERRKKSPYITGYTLTNDQNYEIKEGEKVILF